MMAPPTQTESRFSCPEVRGMRDSLYKPKQFAMMRLKTHHSVTLNSARYLLKKLTPVPHREGLTFQPLSSVDSTGHSRMEAWLRGRPLLRPDNLDITLRPLKRVKYSSKKFYHRSGVGPMTGGGPEAGGRRGGERGVGGLFQSKSSFSPSQIPRGVTRSGIKLMPPAGTRDRMHGV
jgi:hypothetical protein